MKLDEFAFFNQQLSAMLRDGIPLESALANSALPCAAVTCRRIGEATRRSRQGRPNETSARRAQVAAF